MYSKGYHNIKVANNNIFMPRAFGFVIMNEKPEQDEEPEQNEEPELNEESELDEGARPEWDAEDISLHLAGFTFIVRVLYLD